MRYYLAPMEGLTDSIYRRVHSRYFTGVDRYYMPFLSPTVHRSLTPREERELPAANSVGFTAVPQILTRVSDDFLWAAQVCRDRGYREVNLNLGCPSGTVVAKGKGSGMLRQPEALDRFLDDIFTRAPLPISVKTRLGLESPEEFPRLLEIFNQYPIRELTVHPRVRRDFYQGDIREEWFGYAWAHSKNRLCFNGDVTSPARVRQLEAAYPGLDAVMIGRALIADPGMLTGGADRQTLAAFLEELTESYVEAFDSRRNAMFRLKENWGFLRARFLDSDKLWKALRKTTDYAEFRDITRQIVWTLPLAPEGSSHAL